MSKILYSPGYGAGWFTWIQDIRVLTYGPLIEHIEAGGSVGEDHPLIRQMARDLDLQDEYFGGARDLCVEDTQGRPFQVREYDGYEAVHYLDKQRYYVAGADGAVPVTPYATEEE